MKLKKIISESTPGFKNRKFGDKLPTLEDVQREYKESEEEETIEESFNNKSFTWKQINGVLFDLRMPNNHILQVRKALGNL